jgi:glucose/arabinose dehydrogenase
MLDPNLSVKTVVSGLSQPTSMAFIGNNDFFVLEKNTGKVQRVTNGSVQSTVLDLAVNSASERGLLGIALHPNFLVNGYVYLYWTESSTGVDSTNLADVFVPLSNRVDRYIWNGSTLGFDRNLIKLHAYQADANQPLRANHNGGVLRFGPDGKLFILMGDNGRRGLLQNNQLGPVPDDQFGGPEPDDAHLTGFILRLNDDGSTPADNPFFNASTALTGEAAANIKKLYAYGVRNGFGLAFDPLSGSLWDQENGDDAFDEMNRVTAGSNNGWVEMMGPNSRVAQFKQIESTYGTKDLQQVRWPPSLIADTPAAALARLYMLPGAHYNDPEFSWKYAIPASPLGFVSGRGLGSQFEGDMFVGAARTFLAGGFLFRFRLTPDRLHFAFNDARLNDLVADNLDKFDINESESLLIGRDFGITTDIETGPNGDLFVVSNTNSAVYEISGKQPLVFTATLNSTQETPPNNSTATGTATLLLSSDEQTARVSLNFNGLSSAQTAAHIHGPAAPGTPGNILFPLPNGSFSDFLISPSATDVQNLKSGQLYVNVHSSNFLNGEIRGQFNTSTSASSIQFSSASYLVSESAGRATISINRIGDTSTAASVDYATSDTAAANNCNLFSGSASSRCDYSTTIGTVHFGAGEIFKTVSVPLTDDAYAEGNETFTVNLSNPIGVTLGSPATTTVTIADNESTTGANPIDQANFFVHQHYMDFLSREPDSSGFAFWTNEIAGCSPQPQCIDLKRTNVSAAFFLSIEFQDTGYLVERIYKAAYGSATGNSNFGGAHQLPVPIIRLNEFLPDTQEIGQGIIVGQGNWQPQLDNNKAAFTAEFVQRFRFTNAFPNTMTAAQFVDTLNTNAGNPLSQSERDQMISDLSTSAKTRAQVLRAVAEDSDLNSAEFNRAFVLMQYFGYLRRNPNDRQDTDYTGYDFWLTKLNQFNGNFVNAEMVKAFINSTEYRQRFGP